MTRPRHDRVCVSRPLAPERLHSPARLLLLGLFGAGLATAAEAQVHFPSTPVAADVRWPIPDRTTFERTALADVDADHLLDFFFLDGGSLRSIFAPTLFGTGMDPAVQANDLDVWRSYGVYQDAVVTVGEDGAVAHTWAGDLKLWEHDPLSTDPSWADAQLVAVRPLPSGSAQVFGVLDDGVTVRALRSGRDDEIVVSDVPLYDLVFADLDGDGSDLFCMAFERVYRLAVTGTDGEGQEVWSPVQTYPATGFLGVGLVRGRQAATPPTASDPPAYLSHEWVAWLGSWPYTGEQFFTTIDVNGIGAPVLVGGDPGVVAVGGGDWSWNGSTDVALSWTATTEVGVLQNAGVTAPAFDYADILALSYGPDPPVANPGNTVHPVLGDGDNDNDEDLFFVDATTDELWVALNPALDQATLAPLTGGDAGGGTQALSAGAPAGVTLQRSSPARLRFTLQHPATLPGNANAVEVIVFQHPPVPGTTPDVPQGPTAPQTDMYWRETFDPEDPQPMPVSIELEEAFTGGPPFEDELPSIYYWLQRYVWYQGGEVRAVYPAVVYGLHAKGDVAAEGVGSDAYLCDQELASYGHGDPFTILEYVPPGEAPLPTILGNGRPVPCLPDLPGGDPADWGQH